MIDKDHLDSIIEIFYKLRKIKGAKDALREIYDNPDSQSWPSNVRNSIEHKVEEVYNNYLDGIDEINFENFLHSLQEVKKDLGKYPKEPKVNL